MRQKVFWISGLILTTSIIIAQVPNQFKAGDRLNSSKLNENFTYLTKLVKDGAGTVLGQFMGLASNTSFVYSFTPSLKTSSNKIVKIMNDKGYTFGVDMASGKLNNLGLTSGYYSDLACLNPIFATSDQASYNGVVFHYILYNSMTYGIAQEGVYYISRTATPNSTTGSYYTWDPKGGSCTGPYSIASAGFGFYTAIANDPAVTGVSSLTYQLPLAIVNE